MSSPNHLGGVASLSNRKVGRRAFRRRGQRVLLAEGRGGRLRRARLVLLQAIRGNGRPDATVPRAVPPDPFNTCRVEQPPRRALPLRPSAHGSSAPLCVKGFSATVTAEGPTIRSQPATGPGLPAAASSL